MTILIFCIVVITLFLISKKKSRPKKGPQLHPSPYISEDKTSSVEQLVKQFEAQAHLLTPNEHLFFTALKTAIITKYHISTKVRWADVFQVKHNIQGHKRFGLFNKIKSKHIDFVLFDIATGKIGCLIELDDSTHLNPKVQKRDAFQTALCKETNIPLLRQKLASNYNIELLRKDLFQVMDKCHNCGHDMILRIKKHNSGKEHSFRGCSTFPECSFSTNIASSRFEKY